MRKSLAIFFVLCLLSPTPVLAIEGHCVANCDDDSTSYSSGSSSSSYNAAAYSLANNVVSSFNQGFQQGMEANRLANVGMQYYNAKDFQTALYYFQQALALVPNNPTAQGNVRTAQSAIINDKGIAEYRQGNWQAALDYFNQALALHPYHDEEIRYNIEHTNQHLAEEAEEKKKEDQLRSEFMQAMDNIRNAGNSSENKPQEDYSHSLSTKEVPPPVIPESPEKKIAPPILPTPPVIKPGFVDTVKDYAHRVKEKINEWIKDQGFEHAFEHMPGASTAKSVYEKGKEIYNELKSSSENIFKHSMRGMDEGSKRLASPRKDDGGFSDDYQKGLGELGDETVKKSRKLADDTITK